MKHNVLFLIFFVINVSLVSNKFVNQVTTPRLFFSVLFGLVIITICVVFKNNYTLNFFSNKILLLEIFIVCIVQAFYGLMQFFGLFYSNHSHFPITGSFENPAGFSAILSMGYPIGMYLLFKTKRIEQYLITLGLFVILVSIFLSQSRAGILAVLSSSLVVLIFQKKIIQKLEKIKQKKFFIALLLLLFFGLAYSLYVQKKDSVHGRYLIWKVSAEMITNQPFLGHGASSFKAKYMDYQGQHFNRGLSPELEILADDVIHPFNEFIKITVEHGVLGALFIILMVVLIFNKAIREGKVLVLGGLTSFLVFAFFSYPLRYIGVWVLLLFYILQFLPSKKISIKNTAKVIFMRIAITLTCISLIFITCGQIRNEIKWKNIAISSLKGNTIIMLPEYEKLYLTSSLNKNPFFLYNYGAELNAASQFAESNVVLKECKNKLNNFDLQMLIADNYYKLDKFTKAVEVYNNAHDMIPSRFLPLYYIFEIYRESGQVDLATKFANEIVDKKVKVPSSLISLIKSEASKYIKNNT